MSEPTTPTPTPTAPVPRARVAALLCATVVLAIPGALLSRRFDPDVQVTRTTIDGPDGPGTTPAVRMTPTHSPVRGSALLVHGITSAKSSMLLIGEALALRGWDVLAIDFPGHGDADTPFRDGDGRERIATSLVMGARDLEARAALRAGRAEAPDPAAVASIDIVVGHSMGAYTAESAMDRGRLRARLFVSLGARAPDDARPGQRALLLTGEDDPLATPAKVEALAREIGARSVVGPSGHVLEPFDPALVRAIIAEVDVLSPSSLRPDPPRVAPVIRLGGIVLLGLALLPLLPALRLLAGPTPTAARATALGLVAGAALVVAGVLAFDPAWVGLAPRPRSFIPIAGAVVATLLASRITSEVAGAAVGPERGPHVAHALGAVVALALAFGLSTGGAVFVALLMSMGALGVATGCALGVVAHRAVGHPSASHGVFACVVGYGPGLVAGTFV